MMSTIFSLGRSKIISSMYIFQRNIITSIYPNVEIEKRNFTNFILNAMQLHPERIAVIDGITDKKYSYKELEYNIHCVASALTYRGLKKCDKVGMLATNSVDYLTVYLATIGCGATIVAFNPSFTKYELAPLILMTKPKFIFSNSGPLQNVLSSMDYDFVEKKFNMDDDEVRGTVPMKCLLHENVLYSPINDESYKRHDDICLILFSSGTTGNPKGVPITNGNIIATTQLLHPSYAMLNNSILMGILPMYHIFGIMVSFITAIMSSSISIILPSFNPLTFLQSIEKYKITHIHAVPPILLFLLNHADVNKYNLSSVKGITSGAASVDINLETKINNFFLSRNPEFIFVQGYGLTETSGIVSLRPYTQDASKNKTGSVGLILSNQELKIISPETEKELGPNILGEILVKGPNIIQGYIGMSEEQNNFSFKNGWFRTGDLGYYDDDHNIYISDRIKELIKVKGHQVAPAEIEALLLTHPSITDCGVIGVPHKQLGEVPKAFVVKKEDISEKEVQTFVENNLTSYKHLKGGVIFVKSIPKSPSGKLLRKLLKDI